MRPEYWPEILKALGRVCDACGNKGFAGEPNPDCENCNGRGCMSCVFREWDHECQDDCPNCCTCLECKGKINFAYSADDIMEWFMDRRLSFFAITQYSPVGVITVDFGIDAGQGTTLTEALENAMLKYLKVAG